MPADRVVASTSRGAEVARPVDIVLPADADADADADPRPVRRRTALVAAGIGVVVCGLAASHLPGPLGDVVGGVLYAVLVALGVALVARRRVVVAGIALGLCATVELLQATGLPAVLVNELPVLRYVVGTTFYAPDLLAYAGGAVLGAMVAEGIGRRPPSAGGQ